MPMMEHEFRRHIEAQISRFKRKYRVNQGVHYQGEYWIVDAIDGDELLLSRYEEYWDGETEEVYFLQIGVSISELEANQRKLECIRRT